MTFTRHCHKVFRTIIIPNSIDVMNHPIVRELLIMRLLPYIDMLQYITQNCSRIAWFVKFDITLRCFPSASTPIRIEAGLGSHKRKMTGLAKFGLKATWLTTILARTIMPSIFALIVTLPRAIYFIRRDGFKFFPTYRAGHNTFHGFIIAGLSITF